MSECLSESVRPENLVNTTSQKPMKGIPPNLGRRIDTDVFEFIDVLINPRGQRSKVKVTAGNDEDIL